jgi:hypothetical protein
MKIKEMFRDDIDRQINGVVQVEQKEEDVVEQEVKEYVVTTELKKHYTNFFNQYSESFTTPTDNVGVWITGFFGSGKSHFLKMLSYLLENKEIGGKKTVDYFEEKFDDEATFMNVRTSTQVPTETILFNIDSEGFMHKDDTAVLKVFAKVFYEHLGFYGNDLKLAKLEQFISKKGKMDAFKQAYEEINGEPWETSRSDYAFFETDIIDALVQTEVMDEQTAQHWFDGTETADISIGQLVDEIKAYVDTKPNGFRLLFMIDEAGQYIGTNTSMLLNLQTLIEKLGSVCRGQVWIVATGQEALDEMIKVRSDEFSRIMARFAIRLSLTSSSVGEVIEKRLLTKTDDATKTLSQVYENNENALNNLYSFDAQKKDINGYSSVDEFVKVFPFVPYQFKIMQEVFNEIRKHGHAGKHQSSGERSMLNGFQESAQRVEDKNENTLVPMYAFYDTLHSFLDTSVRGVVERAERAAENNQGLTVDDVNLLKLLYLIRYVEDIPSNIENLTILFADDISVNKLDLRTKIKESLERLVRQNYVARNGEIYNFLTDEEQDIAREINNTTIEASEVISEVSKVLFDNIYDTKKFKYGKTDYEFDKCVDGMMHGLSTGGMKLQFITEAADNQTDQQLMMESSKEYEAICRLSTEYKYFDNIQTSLKISKYIRTKNVYELPDSIQKIIASKQAEAKQLLQEAKNQLEKAIMEGTYFITGEIQSVQGTTTKARLDNILDSLVEHTYTSMNLITHSVEDESEVKDILRHDSSLTNDNQEACDDVKRYLEMHLHSNVPTSMSDILNKYKDIPYGWRELDVVGVVAQLLSQQLITIKYGGETIQTNDYRIVDLLRKKNYVGSVSVAIREQVSTQKMNQARDILKGYFNAQDVPSDEDGLVNYIKDNFNQVKKRIEDLNKGNQSATIYPGNNHIHTALDLINKLLLAQSDNNALINKLCELEVDLLGNKENMEDVYSFFDTQKTLYDNAMRLKREVKNEEDFLMSIPEIKDAYDKIDEITRPVENFQYNRIPQLNSLISTINDIRNNIISEKKNELHELADICLDQVKEKASSDEKLNSTYQQAIQQFESEKRKVDSLDDLLSLNSKELVITGLKDTFINKMDSILRPVVAPTTPKPKLKKKTQIPRSVVFNSTTLSSEEDVDRYVQQVKNKLLSYLNDGEEIEIR